MTYLCDLVTAAPDRRLTLGAVEFDAEQFQVQYGRAVRKQLCADGRTLCTVLPEGTCTLELSGRAMLAESAAGTLLTALHTLMTGETAFSFRFAGCDFARMRLTGCTLKSSSPQTAVCTLTLTGIPVSGEEASV
ncbi:MAG: hypothetical protein K6E36_11415 [Oscillospiraceae bacterium]|nr:hypothetical protein [Oscillospiraceae bacterium]